MGCIWIKSTPQTYEVTEGELWLLVHDWVDLIVAELTDYRLCGQWRAEVMTHAAQRLRLLADTLGGDRVHETIAKELECMTGRDPQMQAFFQMLGACPEG